MKGVFIIIDGVADEPSNSLGGKTPLEFAKTPNLDVLAKKSKIDYCYTIKEGMAPQSSSAVVSLMGFDYRLAPRGPLESEGYGIKLKNGDLAFRCNFATIDNLQSGRILDSRAGRTLTTAEAKELAKAINETVKLPFPFEFHATSQHRAVLVFRGGFSDNISNANPFYGDGVVNNTESARMVWSQPLDDDDESKLSADLLNLFIRKSHEVLNNHPINLSRARKGLFSANILLCRDAGSNVVRFKKMRGKWMALGYMPLEKGIAKACSMEVYDFKYPRLRGIDVYHNLYKGLRRAIKYSIKMMKRYRKRIDYFYIHFKETDIPGHDNKPFDKVKMIEMLDARFFKFLNKFANNSRIVVTADHTTSCRKKAHTSDPVPVLSYPAELFVKNVSSLKSDRRFCEKDALDGKKWIGNKLLEGTLYKK